VISLGENNKQEAERQIQEATSENSSGDRAEGDPPTQEATDGSSEKEPKKTEETLEETRKAKVDSEADKVKAETPPSEAPRIAAALTAEPEEQEQPKRPQRAVEAPAPAPPATISRSASVASEAQPLARATTPLYWRRLTARYMTVGPQPS
jgi:hypothetical protein